MHEPTIADQAREARELRELIRVFDLDVPSVPYLDQRPLVMAALREREEQNTDQLERIADRQREFGPSATLMALRVSLELEQQTIRQALA